MLMRLRVEMRGVAVEVRCDEGPALPRLQDTYRINFHSTSYCTMYVWLYSCSFTDIRPVAAGVSIDCEKLVSERCLGVTIEIKRTNEKELAR